MIAGGIYIHVPFCLSKCFYCDFYSVNHNAELLEQYYINLLKEINVVADKYPLKAETLYFGGGTPSLLTKEHLIKIIELVKQKFNLENNVEITIEANPDTVSLIKAQEWYAAGINRVSVGFQSASNSLLQILGRRHTIEQTKTAIKSIQNAGIDNINIDLMYGLPKQSIKDWEQTLKYCLELNVKHISAYPLQIEENTKLANLIDNGELKLISDDITVEMMFLAKKLLEENGFNHYEIANYAKEGYYSRHNKIYWHAKPYLGFGPSAASYYNEVRFSNSADLNRWQNEIQQDGVNIDTDSKKLEVQIAEFCFLSLRLLQEGLSRSKFKQKFKIDIDDIYGNRIKNLVKKQLLVDNKGVIRLTPQAIPLANQVFVEFLPDSE